MLLRKLDFNNSEFIYLNKIFLYSYIVDKFIILCDIGLQYLVFTFFRK